MKSSFDVTNSCDDEEEGNPLLGSHEPVNYDYNDQKIKEEEVSASTAEKEKTNTSGICKSPLCKCCCFLFDLLLKDSWLGASFNLSNTSIGSGILFLPFIIRQCGIVIGLLSLWIGGVTSMLTLYLLHLTFESLTDEEKHKDLEHYEQIGKVLFPKWYWGSIFEFGVQFCVFCVNFGCSISYLIVISNILDGWITNSVVHDLVLLGVVVILLIVSFNPYIQLLEIPSFIAMVGMFVFIFLIALCYWLGLTSGDKKGSVIFVPNLAQTSTYSDILSNLGVVCFSYACHSQFCPISREFPKKRRNRVAIGVFLSILTDFTVYVLVAVFGYLSFLANTESDIIQSYTQRGTTGGVSSNSITWVYSVLRAILLLCMICTYPLVSYPARLASCNFIKGLVRYWCKKKTHCCVDITLAFLAIVIIGLIAYTCSIFYPHASDITSLVGSTACTFTVYVFPCTFYIKRFKPSWWSCRLWGILFVLAFGCFFGGLITVSSLISMFQKGLS